MSKTLDFVNIHGQKVDTTKRVKLAKRESATEEKFHKGWRVVGVSPEAVAAARAEREKAIKSAIKRNVDVKAGVGLHRSSIDVPVEFDAAAWIPIAPLKPARTRPFEIESAVVQCFELAKKAGWQRLEIRRLAKGIA